jgi:polysaccharide pyruvyl transferase WcaK-like protein
MLCTKRYSWRNIQTMFFGNGTMAMKGRLRRIRTHNTSGECITPIVIRRDTGSHNMLDLIPTHYVCNLHRYIA